MSESNPKEPLSVRLRQVRLAEDKTQKEFSEIARIPLTTLRDYELGKRLPGAEALMALVAAGINANWLLMNDGPMYLFELEERPPPTTNQIEAELDNLEMLRKVRMHQASASELPHKPSTKPKDAQIQAPAANPPPELVLKVFRAIMGMTDISAGLSEDQHEELTTSLFKMLDATCGGDVARIASIVNNPEALKAALRLAIVLSGK